MEQFRTFHELHKDAEWIRNTVFIEEQGFPEEVDAMDAAATHIVLYQDNHPIAVCRFFWNEEKNAYIVGRLAVIKERRGQNWGAAMLREAERQIRELHGKKVVIDAQVHARKFYEKQNYQAVGEAFLEEGKPHIRMEKALQ